MKNIALAVSLGMCATLAVAQTTKDPQIKPEMVVRFSQSTIACASKDGLQAITEALMRGEQTKANALMIASGNPDGECLMLSPKQKVKVISVQYNDSAMDFGLLEIVGPKIASASKGAWAFSIGAVPVK